MDKYLLTDAQKKLIGTYTQFNIRKDPTCDDIGACVDVMIKKEEIYDFLVKTISIESERVSPISLSIILLPIFLKVEVFFLLFIDWLNSRG
jgi:hypothetical protein